VKDEDEFVRHLDSLGVPHDIRGRERRGVGLDRNTEEGALVAFAGSLLAHKPLHRVIAWVLLLAFALPVVLGLLHLAGLLFGWLAG
jgi:hypothetical protein